jgi:two-component sensor histidine kinase
MEERTRELREKEVLLKEIHHRVKNNLQVISSLVSLQADGAGDETTRGGLRDVMYRVRSMALVHEKLYQSADLARIDFAEYTRSLLNYLWRAHASTAAVRLTFDLQPLSLPVDTAVPCGLILNELAGNALKHAFKGRSEGEVTVSLHSGADGRIRLCVADNGVGIGPGRSVYASTNVLGFGAIVGMQNARFSVPYGQSGGLTAPLDIAFGPDGNLYVVSIDFPLATDSPGRVMRYDGLTGAFIDTFIAAGTGNLIFPSDLLFQGDILLISDTQRGVLRFDANTGAPLGVFIAPGSGVQQMTLGPSGDLFAREGLNKCTHLA